MRSKQDQHLTDLGSSELANVQGGGDHEQYTKPPPSFCDTHICNKNAPPGGPVLQNPVPGKPLNEELEDMWKRVMGKWELFNGLFGWGRGWRPPRFPYT